MSSPDQDPTNHSPDLTAPLAEIGAAVLRELLASPEGPAILDLSGLTVGVDAGEVTIDADGKPPLHFTVTDVASRIYGDPAQ